MGYQRIFDPKEVYGFDSGSTESDEDFFIGHGTGEVDWDSGQSQSYSDE